MKRITQNEFRDMPWKNGRGITTEIFRLPHDGEFKLRLSVATISEDGLFSNFKDVDRTLMILQGKGVELCFSTKTVILTPDSKPLSFQGEDQIKCHLINGPVTDFNVMIERGWGTADLKRIKNPEGVVSDDFLFLYRQGLLIQLAQGESYNVEGEYLEINIKRAQTGPAFT